jgi:osmoprotectant transport system permease protein
MQDIRGMVHALAYTALNESKIDVMDAYSTDAKLAEYDLTVLEDDLNFFPKYNAVFLYRLVDTAPGAIAAVRKLEGSIDEGRMIRLNAEAERTKDYTQAAALYFGEVARIEPFYSKITRWTARHLQLVGISMLIAILIGLPLGIWASRPGLFSQFIFGLTGIIQTIPSLALLVLFIPLLGIGVQTAVVALFLYSLLPIVRNTASGLQDIPTPLRESAGALGLEPSARLIKVFLPMASRTILTGIKTSAIINVGTATLAALIGAGGLGEPIISGLDLNDTETILQGAIPSAILALLVQFFFDGLDRLLIPKGLRLEASKGES